MAIDSGACTKVMRSTTGEGSQRANARFISYQHDLNVELLRASNAPATISSGAWSPPIASTAMRARFTGAVFGGHPGNPCLRSTFALALKCAAWYYLPAMAKRCEVCGKGPKAGNNVSHAMNKTKAALAAEPAIRSDQTTAGTPHRQVCTSCLRSKRVTRPRLRRALPEVIPAQAIERRPTPLDVARFS